MMKMTKHFGKFIIQLQKNQFFRGKIRILGVSKENITMP